MFKSVVMGECKVERILSAIDIGTNSTRLLTVKLCNTAYQVLAAGNVITRLGRQVDSSGKLGQSQMLETARVIADFADIAKSKGSEMILAIATSAVRDAQNKEEFISMVKEMSDIDVTVISGHQEAALSYSGAMLDVKESSGVIVFDIGGGSTEIIADRDNAVSLDVGAVRMTERFLSYDSPDDSSRQQVYQYVIEQLEAAQLKSLASQSAIGVGGTVTTYAAIAQELEPYDSSKVHGYLLQKDELERIVKGLSAMNKEQRTAVKGLQPKRADIIIAGGIILMALLDYFGLKCIKASETDILYGIINEYMVG